MKTRFIPAIITLLAATAVSIINIVNQIDLTVGLKRLLIVIVIFYIFGTLVKMVVHRTLVKKEDLEAVVEDTNDTIQSSEDELMVEDSSTNDKIDELVKKS